MTVIACFGDSCGGSISASRPVATARSNSREIAFDQRHDRFALGIAEADVIFDQLGPIGGEHQAGIEDAAEWSSCLGKCSRSRPDDLVHGSPLRSGVSTGAGA